MSSKPYFECNLPEKAPEYLNIDLAEPFEKACASVRARTETLNAALALSKLKPQTFQVLASALFKSEEATYGNVKHFDAMTPKEIARYTKSVYCGIDTEEERLDWPNAEVLFDTAFATVKEWEMLRHLGIGGSDSATIQGVSHWKCERHLYHDKIGTPMKNEAKAVFARGHFLEDTVISTFCKHTGATRIRDTRMFRSVKYPHCIADIDAILRMPDDSIYLFEAKTTITENRAAWANNNVPSYYLWQTRHYPAVLDDERVKGTFIGCLFTVDYQLGDTYIGSQFSPEGKGFVSRLVERDTDMEDLLLSRDEEWWDEHITMSVEPEISADEEKEMSFQQSVSGGVDTSLPPLDLGNYIDVGQRYLEVAAEISLLEKQIENKRTELSLYKMQFIDELGENIEGRIPLSDESYIEVKYAPKKKTTVNTELLESIYPRAYADCVTIDPYGIRVFTLREKKIKPDKGKKVR